MPNPDLKITAEADVQPAVKGLQDVQKSLLATSAAAKTVNPAMATVQQSLAKTAIASNALDSSLKKVVPGANQAGQALTNVGRVAQDLPFGFIGIQNNLNPLLESFQRLKAESGSTGGALKALGSSLIGPAGIGIALSLVSSAFVIFQNGIAGFNKKTKEGTDNADKFKESIKAIFADAGKEAAEALSLIAVINSQNESYKRKADALKELKRIQPEYFGQLKLEAGAVAGLDEAYKLYLANFKNVIAAKIIQARLEAAITKQIERQGVAGSQLGTGKKLLEISQKTGEAAQKEFEIRKKMDAFNQKAAETEERNIENLFKQLTEVSKGIDIKVSKDGTTKAAKDIRTISDVLKELRLELLTLTTTELQLGTNEARGKISALEGAIKELITKFGKPGKDNTVQLFAEIRDIQFVEKLRKNLETQVKGQEFKITPVIAIEPIIKKGVFEERLAEFLLNKEAFQKKVDEFNDLVNTSLANIGAGALANLGDAIAGALTGKSITGLFDSIFISVGDQIQQLGKFLIKSGIQIKLAKEAFKKLLASPIASIAVGIGLVALGALIKAAVNNKPKGFASGSRSTPGGTFLVGERGPERIFLPQGSRVQPNNEMTAYNGGSQVMIPDLRIDGSTFVIGFKRAEARMNRNGSVAQY